MKSAHSNGSVKSRETTVMLSVGCVGTKRRTIWTSAKFMKRWKEMS